MLESLDLSNSIFNPSLEAYLCTTVSKYLPKLRRLALNNVKLRRSFLSRELFLDVLLHHPSLEDIELSNNNFGGAVATFLREALTATNPVKKLGTVDVSYNGCSGSDLLQAGREVIDSGASKRGALLRRLNISGRLNDKATMYVIISLWTKLAGHVECGMDDICAEHQSQM